MELVPKRILVFGAHSDDEIIGMGGTIGKFSEEGSNVYLVTFTKGETGYSNLSEKEVIAQMRAKEGDKSARILGIKEVINLGYPCQSAPKSREVFQECVRLIRFYKPDVIFTHYYEDKHRDHRAVSEITDEARWKATEDLLPQLGKPYYVHHLYYYEVLEHFTHPSLVIDVTSTFAKKVQALKVHQSQSKILKGVITYIYGLARARGYLCSGKYGEAFLKSNFLPQIIK